MQESNIFDVSNCIVCDRCNEDYSNSEEKGGFVFSGHSFCPKCSPEVLEGIKQCGEENYIEFKANLGE